MRDGYVIAFMLGWVSCTLFVTFVVALMPRGLFGRRRVSGSVREPGDTNA